MRLRLSEILGVSGMSYKFTVPAGWIESQLQEYCLKVADGTHDSPKKTEQGKLLVTSKNIIGGTLDLSKSYRISEEDFDDVNRRSKVDKHDVLLSMIGTVGEVCLIEREPDFAIKNVGLLKNQDSLKAKWLYFYLTSPQAQAQIKERLRGTTQQYLPLGEIRKFPIIYPSSRSEMQEMVGVLAAIQNKIQLNHQINQTLEQMAQAIFKSWFVDFEPVKAKIAALEAGGSEEDALLAAMQAISGKGEAELTRLQAEQPEQYAELRATAELFPSAMQDSELGEIPVGWRSGQLKDICEFQNGYAFKSKDWSDAGFSVVKIGSVKPAFVDIQSCSYVEDKTIVGLERFELFAGDLLVGMTGYPGETGLVPKTENRVFLNQRVGRLKPRQSNLKALLYCSVRAPDFKQYVEGQSHGSAQANVSGKAIGQYPITIPTDSVVGHFSGLIDPLIQQKLNLNAEATTLAITRDTLLPRLISGEIAAPEIKDQSQEAAGYSDIGDGVAIDE